MNLRRRRVSFSAVSYKPFRHMLCSGLSSNVNTCNIMIRDATAAENLESEQVVEKMNRSGDYNTLISDMSKAEELSRAADRTRQVKRLRPNKTTYTSLIDSFCKQDRFDVASRVLNEMIVSGFRPSFVILNDVLRGFLRLRDIRNAYEMRKEINQHTVLCWLKADYDRWMDEDTKLSLYQGLSDEVTYTSLMNVYIDEGKLYDAEDLYDDLAHDFDETFSHKLPLSVIESVYINGIKNLFRFNYKKSWCTPILEYHSTLSEYCCAYNKSLVELVNSFYNRGLENAYDELRGRIDDGMVYNLYVIAHCKRHNIDEAYNMYKDMVHYGFTCHVFTVFALIKTLKREDMVNELLWVIQNVLRSCYSNSDSRIVDFLNEFNPKEPDNEALFDVLAEKALIATGGHSFHQVPNIIGFAC